MHWRKHIRTAAALATCLTLMASPALAYKHDEAKPGPIPLAMVGVVLGPALWLISVPFCVVLAPRHILDSFDGLVIAPVRAVIGVKIPHIGPD